jgi:dolichol-phosphate mannosyltransferase
MNKLSVIIPAKDEAENISLCIDEIRSALNKEDIDNEILVIDDGSTDQTYEIVSKISRTTSSVKCIKNLEENGFGRAIRLGLNHFKGDAVAIMMADRSDSPKDLVKYWKTLQDGYDCAMGSRFVSGGSTHNYPKIKLIINRLVNTLIRYAFRIESNDITNAFKMYRRDVITGCSPLISPHFNLTVEIPLKAIIRGYSYKVLPISWKNRTKGVAKLKLREMGSRYFFIIAYLCLEKYFSCGDYKR